MCGLSRVMDALAPGPAASGGYRMNRPNGIKLGPRARRIVRFAARLINPVILSIAGRRWMPVLGVLRLRGRKSGRIYTTPLGMRPLGDAFVMPRTFGEN